MEFGITNEGFVAKRLEDIKKEQEDILKNKLGININLKPSSTLGQLVGVNSARMALIWELLEGVYNSQFPNTATGANLDLVASITGISRLSATNSAVDIKLFGDDGTFIPQGTQISRADNVNVIFSTSIAGTIGSGSNEIQFITFSNTPDIGSFKLSHNGVETNDIPFGATASDIEFALNSLPDLSSVLVTGGFSTGFTIEFSGVDGKKPQNQLLITDNTLFNQALPTTVTNVTITEGDLPNVVVKAFATELGEIPAPAGTLTQIQTPITGLDSAINLDDAILGREEETDAELKIRRDRSLQLAGAATVDAIFSQLSSIEGVRSVKIFENEKYIVDDQGRPPKSYEAVVQGGDEDVIAKAIWDTKPAGIETFGSLEKITLDSQGFNQIVKFSRPTSINVYITVNLVTNSKFNANAPSVIEQNIVNFGQALEVGEDVITIPKLICVLSGIDGITDADIFIGTSANPTNSDNILVNDNEIAIFDTSRINITVS